MRGGLRTRSGLTLGGLRYSLGSRGFVGTHYDVLPVWQQFATDVRGAALDCGHYLPEEQPQATAAALGGELTAPERRYRERRLAEWATRV